MLVYLQMLLWMLVDACTHPSKYHNTTIYFLSYLNTMQQFIQHIYFTTTKMLRMSAFSRWQRRRATSRSMDN